MEEFLPIPDLVNIVNEYVLKPLPYIDEIHTTKHKRDLDYDPFTSIELGQSSRRGYVMSRCDWIDTLMRIEENQEVDKIACCRVYGPTCACQPFQHICHDYTTSFSFSVQPPTPLVSITNLESFS